MCVITGFGRTQGTANEKVMNQQTLPIVENKQVKILFQMIRFEIRYRATTKAFVSAVPLKINSRVKSFLVQ